MERGLPSPPSAVALHVAEELLDHVSYGLTRGEQITDMAALIDEAYSALVASAHQVVLQSIPSPPDLERLREVLAAHLPPGQGESLHSSRSTATAGWGDSPPGR